MTGAFILESSLFLLGATVLIGGAIATWVQTKEREYGSVFMCLLGACFGLMLIGFAVAAHEDRVAKQPTHAEAVTQ